MQPDNTDRPRLDRQAALARPILLALALVDLLEVEPAQANPGAVLFVGAYLLIALIFALRAPSGRGGGFELPLEADVAALAVLLLLTPSVTAFWFFYLFVVFSAGARWGARAAMVLALIFTLALAARTAVHGSFDWNRAVGWIVPGIGTLAAGVGLSLGGARERRHLADDRFLTRLSSLPQVEKGLAESIHMVLDEIARAFECELACLAVRDDDLERLFVWKVSAKERELMAPETFPLARADAYLTDNLEASVCWNSLEGPGKGFAWDRRSREWLAEPPRPPASLHQELGARSLLGVTLGAGGQPVGRVLLANRERKFTARELRWLEQVVAHLGQPLDNVFQLRHLRARAVEAERSRISRDLHDGILQTLLSLNIQLDVLRRKLPHAPEQAEAELAALQRTVQQESEELRRMVTDLRPLRVESADLPELMYGFAERYRNESGLALDLFLDGRDLRVPDRVCRELFQIYRESLHNVKKHARASHVVVKLGQDETKVFLVVDDNGQGFSFSGRYTSEELDELRLGPISIKERTRSVGGVLTVESNPGHGARLTVEIPLS